MINIQAWEGTVENTEVREINSLEKSLDKTLGSTKTKNKIEILFTGKRKVQKRISVRFMVHTLLYHIVKIRNKVREITAKAVEIEVKLIQKTGSKWIRNN